MPILRRDETPDELGPRFVYLWEKKWWAIGPAVLAAVLAYVIMLAVPDSFTASADLYVNRLAVFQDNQASPDTVATLLKSSEVLKQVQDAYSAQFKTKAPPIEKFVKQFQVKSDILQDTSVKRDVSPILVLSVETRGREEAQFLIQKWIDISVHQFGNFATDEARIKLAALRKDDAALEVQLKEAESQRAQHQAALSYQEKLLAENMDLLAPAELRMPAMRSSSGRAEGSAAAVGDVTMQVAVQQAKAPGLISRLYQVRVNLQLASANGSATTSAQALKAESAALETVIAEIQTSVTELQKTVAGLQQKVDTAAREIQVKSDQQRELHRFMDKVAVIAGMAQESEKGLTPVAGGDIRAITSPTLPELRVWPKKTLVSAVAALATFVICIAALLFHRFVRAAAAETSS